MYWHSGILKFINCSHLTSYIFAFALTNIDALCLFYAACTAVSPQATKKYTQTDTHTHAQHQNEKPST